MTAYRDRLYEKLAISLPSHAAETARRAVRLGKAPSVSAYIATAIEEKAERLSLDELLDEWLEESGGPATPEETRWAEYQLSSPRRGKPPPWPASFGPPPRSKKRARSKKKRR